VPSSPHSSTSRQRAGRRRIFTSRRPKRHKSARWRTGSTTTRADQIRTLKSCSQSAEGAIPGSCAPTDRLVSWISSSRCPLYPSKRTKRKHIGCPLRAKSGLTHRSKQHLHSTTSSAISRNSRLIVSPSSLAVFRLITRGFARSIDLLNLSISHALATSSCFCRRFVRDMAH
jgi:hypothetical protein